MPANLITIRVHTRIRGQAGDSVIQFESNRVSKRKSLELLACQMLINNIGATSIAIIML